MGISIDKHLLMLNVPIAQIFWNGCFGEGVAYQLSIWDTTIWICVQSLTSQLQKAAIPSQIALANDPQNK